VRSVSIVRIASRSCAACSNRSALRGLGHPLAQRPQELVVAPLEEQLRVLDGDARTRPPSRGAWTQGAMQRLISNSRHGRPRSPVIVSLHDRIPNSRCVSDMVLRASEAGMNGPA
jgi:hypothetical protein